MNPRETGRIMIYRNQKKPHCDKTPEYRGGLLLDGKIYDIGLGVYQSRSGRKFLSGTVKEIPEVIEHINSTIHHGHLDVF